ncbi:MAG: hypothetical protein HY043_04200 [Verrucomicrobia bacterium]|nr:hypothetical protein [Verrucomicrobiota bacterium]
MKVSERRSQANRGSDLLFEAKRIDAPAESACELLLGSDDGKWIFESIFAALKNKTVAQAA